MNSSCNPIFFSKCQCSTISVAVALLIALSASLQANDSPFKTGKALETVMRANITVSSAGDTLTDQLNGLQQSSNVAILKDRRLDPRQSIHVNAVSVSRFRVLQQMAEAIPGASFCLTERMAVIGPAFATSRLPILLRHNKQQLDLLRRNVEATSFRKFTTDRNSSWETLAEPRSILVDQARLAGFTLRNPDDIPHDVWPATQLPEMPFIELSTIVLNQFDLTVKVDPEEPELLIVPVDPHMKLEYPFAVPSRIKARLAETWAQSMPHLNIKWTGTNALVTATLEQLAILNFQLEAMRFADSSSAASKAASIRTQSFLLKADSSTVGQLVEYFRMNNIRIEVTSEDSEATTAIFQQVVSLADLKDKLPGTEFFPRIFGRYFHEVKVLDDRVILSN